MSTRLVTASHGEIARLMSVRFDAVPTQFSLLALLITYLCISVNRAYINILPMMLIAACIYYYKYSNKLAGSLRR